LHELETNILEVLSKTKGSILDDEAAVSVVTSSKILANEISEKQRLGEETENKINSIRQYFRPLVVDAAVLFFACINLSKIESMYQYSLQWFIDLFIESIDFAPKNEIIKERIKNIRSHFMYSIFCNISRSIYDKDKVPD
jgi:dynein heavy chain